jgi:autotransporter-associated beta strand protein
MFVAPLPGRVRHALVILIPLFIEVDPALLPVRPKFGLPGFPFPLDELDAPFGNVVPGLTDITATVNVALAGGAFTSITPVISGLGYTSAPLVTITDSTGTGATATAVLTSGRVTAVNITNAGTGYSASPVVTIAAPAVTSVPNSYTGATAISAGTLALSGSHASAISIASGAVLEFTLNDGPPRSPPRPLASRSPPAQPSRSSAPRSRAPLTPS